ncbi:MAG: protein TonB [Akkermansiaceae bacterium]|jgi:protein TonB
MSLPKPTLDMTFSARRELLFSTLGSVVVTGMIGGILALMTLQISHNLIAEDAAQPLVMNTVSEDLPVVESEETPGFQASPAVPAAPSLGEPVVQIPTSQTSAIPVPLEVEVPVMDDLGWSEEPFEPWEEEKKPEAKKTPVPQRIAKKRTPAPRKTTIVTRPPARPSTVKPVSARVVSRASPTYPSKARRSGVEGSVVVTVTIGTTGHVSSARVTSSSRHSSLDAAALRAAKKYRFTPAKNSRGQVVSTQVSLPFRFKLT